jgi:hypothetical protein
MGRNHLKIPKGWPKPPFPLRDSTSILGASIMVCERSVGGWVCINSAWAVYPFLTTTILTDDEVSLQLAGGKRFFLSPDAANGDSVQHYLEAYKRFALREGATPEAIRLLDLHLPLTKKDVKTLTKEKAEKKAKAPKAEKKAKEPKAQKASDLDTKAKEPKAQKASDLDTKKIKVLEKENPYRAESNRAASWDALKGAKTVADYRAAGGAMKYITRWESEGKISLS